MSRTRKKTPREQQRELEEEDREFERKRKRRCRERDARRERDADVRAPFQREHDDDVRFPFQRDTDDASCTLDDARKLVDDWSERVTQTCPQCETKSYAAATMLPAEWLKAEGWTDYPDRAGMIRRCQACSEARPYAWTRRLDLARVCEWMDTRSDTAFVLDELKALL